MGRRVIDLTITVAETMQTFAAPWHPAVEITQLGRHGVENRETRRLVLGTHTGTHVDAPLHFVANGQTVDQLSPEVLVGPASVIDLSWAAEKHEVTAAELRDAIAGRDLERLVLKFGWEKRIGADAYFRDHAFLSEDACHDLVASGCRLLAMDTPQPDNPLNGRNSPNDAPNHKILLGGGVVLVEYLTNLSALRRDDIELIVAPLKIAGGDGAPARCFAVEHAD